MKIGIMGGTFNPVHCGHVNAAVKARDLLSLDSLFVIPAAIPPHKEFFYDVTDNDRFEMTKLAFRRFKHIYVSDLELKRSGKSYSVNTVEEFMRIYPNDELFLIVGTDMFLSIETWFRFVDILKTVTFVGFPRDYFQLDSLFSHRDMLIEKYNAMAVVLDIPPFPAASTPIRDILKSGGTLSGVLPKTVYSYILKRGLYI